MSTAKINFLLALAVVIFVSLACGNLGKNETASNGGGGANSANSGSTAANKGKNTNTTTTAESGDDDSTSGAEKQKPAPGKGNVQGKVLYNDQPVEGIEVRICENFSTIMGIRCDGKTLTTKTGADGVFVLADLDPKTYGGLTAKVFKSAYYVFPQEGIMTAQKFNVEADKTIFARDIHLYKDDVKIVNPKAGSKADAKNLELKWEAYPDAAYYKISLYPDAGGLPPISGERVDEPSYSVTEELANGKYRLRIEVYNARDRKLAESPNDIKFTVTGGAETEAKP
ncbi:MAG: hypothetical protein M3384_18715 [Acidobacteriota bacterium]|nr:hypothetical protein [Acidobacteriota bacterium]